MTPFEQITTIVLAAVVGYIVKHYFGKTDKAVTWDALDKRCEKCRHERERFEDKIEASIKQLFFRFDAFKDEVLRRLPMGNDGK